SPMASGLLTGKYTRTTVDSIAADDWRRKYSEHFREPALTANLALVEKLEQIASRFHRNVAELALAWVLRRNEVTAAIVGARHPGQIEQTAAASDWQLPAEVVDEIEDLLAARETQIASLLHEV
ncbi:MAG TPA: aldo/keto reductase, partial [Anaerolineales bacterium]